MAFIYIQAKCCKINMGSHRHRLWAALASHLPKFVRSLAHSSSQSVSQSIHTMFLFHLCIYLCTMPTTFRCGLDELPAILANNIRRASDSVLVLLPLPPELESRLDFLVLFWHESEEEGRQSWVKALIYLTKGKVQRLCWGQTNELDSESHQTAKTGYNIGRVHNSGYKIVIMIIVPFIPSK